MKYNQNMRDCYSQEKVIMELYGIKTTGIWGEENMTFCLQKCISIDLLTIENKLCWNKVWSFGEAVWGIVISSTIFCTAMQSKIFLSINSKLQSNSFFRSSLFISGARVIHFIFRGLNFYLVKQKCQRNVCLQFHVRLVPYDVLWRTLQCEVHTNWRWFLAEPRMMSAPFSS